MHCRGECESRLNTEIEKDSRDEIMDKIFVARSSMPELEEYIQEIKELWETHWLTNMGVKHEQFTEGLKDFLDVPNISLFCNGHMGLEMAIQAMNFPKNSEIITTPFTFASTTHAIVRNDLKPVFCDIREDNYTIDADKIETLITDKTVAILPVHVYGHICDVDKIQEIADKYRLKVIYDAAHAFGEKYQGCGIGNYGDASLFSFHATKVFNSIEGGGVVCKDEQLGERLYQLRNFGITDAENVDAVGANGKMNEFAAAMGICNLRHIEQEIARRKRVYVRYIERLYDVKGIRIPVPDENVLPNYAYFPILIEDAYGIKRDIVHQMLERHRVYPRKYFYPCVNEFGCYKSQYDASQTPIAREISYRILTLPIYADLALEDVDRICDIMKEKK